MSDARGGGETRTLSPSQLVAWAEDNTQIMRLRTGQDLLPGGYLAALTPGFDFDSHVLEPA